VQQPEHAMQVDISKWSGEGEFTQVVIDRLKASDTIALLRIEDAPATRSDADFNFISNEIYVVFSVPTRGWLRRVLPGRREVPTATLGTIESLLSADAAVGAPDYGDEGMLQYLKTERVVPPYQTRGYKIVELVRIYDATLRR
jgi:hypothetical protein